jgi:hypothetical protein
MDFERFFRIFSGYSGFNGNKSTPEGRSQAVK